MSDYDDEKLNELGKQLNLESLSAKFGADAGTDDVSEINARVTTFLDEYHKIENETFGSTKLNTDFDLDAMQTKQLHFAKLFYHYAKETKMFGPEMTKKQFYTQCFSFGLVHYMMGAEWVHRDLHTYMNALDEMRKDPDKARKLFEQMLKGDKPSA